MKTIKITVKRVACYKDLMNEYENPIEHACDMQLGHTFIVENCVKPEGMCGSAWETMLPFVKERADGGGSGAWRGAGAGVVYVSADPVGCVDWQGVGAGHQSVCQECV